MSAALDAYIKCALWSSIHPDTDEPLDLDYSAEDLAPETVTEMARELLDFTNLCREQGILPPSELLPVESFAHDFWLTRNGHGAGFWDRGLGALGDKLTEAAKSFGASDLYVNDDGRIYVN